MSRLSGMLNTGCIYARLFSRTRSAGWKSAVSHRRDCASKAPSTLPLSPSAAPGDLGTQNPSHSDWIGPKLLSHARAINPWVMKSFWRLPLVWKLIACSRHRLARCRYNRLPRRFIMNINRKACDPIRDANPDGVMKVPRGAVPLFFTLNDASGAGGSIAASPCNRQKVHAQGRYVIVT